MRFLPFPSFHNRGAKYLLCLFCIWVVFSLLVTWWAKLDTLPFLYDQGVYLQISLKMYHAFQHSFFDFIRSIFSWHNEYNFSRPHRVLMTFSTALFHILFGPGNDNAIVTNIAYAAVLFLAVYRIGSKMFNGKIGLFAVFILATFPLLFSAARQYRPELVVAAMVASCIFLILHSDCFKKRPGSFLFGACFGLGMLSKELFLVHMSGPLLVTAVFVFFAPDNSRIQKINFCVSIALGSALASLWYIPHFSSCLEQVRDSYSQDIISFYGKPRFFTLAWVMYYPLIIISEGISFFYAMLASVFILLHIFKKKFFCFCISSSQCFTRWIVLSWIVVPYLILLTANDKVALFYLPALPAFALVISSFIFSVNLRKLKRALIVLCILFGPVQVFAFNFGLNFLPQSVQWEPQGGEKNIFGMPVVFFQQPSQFRPQHQDWKTREILSSIYSLQRGSAPYCGGQSSGDSAAQGPYAICFVPNCSYFSFEVFSAEQLLLGPPLAEFNIVGGVPGFPSAYGLNAEECTYIVTKSGDQGGLFGRPFDEVNTRAMSFLGRTRMFTPLPQSFNLPDGSQATIYKKTGLSE
jgi:4-amino-4-deoxy-L-arabinose transferase-like glycosyltransferase